ncbi:TPA: glycine zipper family protein [Vibrio vulnificus]|uniref:glycine zipper family protein n=1 Tax=Vibrio vulnificus TaxID=672 RepID=UPI0019D48381|nr:glycine zipper family protein [Vibrio vulnificus]MBN8087140.1 glycine zipper family protein [Vibrio vulnificus]MBN8119134.1 glycine zipper family protein [Vibrio vulnificus]
MKSKLLMVLLFSSSTQASLIIDKNGIDEKDYIYDLHQCEALSEQVEKETQSRGAVGGALKGAAIGSAGTAIAGGSGSEGAKKGAAVGLAAGVIGGSRDRRENNKNYQEQKHQVLRNCMTNRGYVVLN